MAVSTLLRSVATKMARAPPRLPSSLERHGRLPTSSRFSTSSGSTSPPTDPKGPQTHSDKVPSGSQWYRVIEGINGGLSMAPFLLLFGGFAYVHSTLNPALDRIKANMDAQHVALVTMGEEFEKHHERIRATLRSDNKSQIEVADGSSEGQRITGIGTK